MAISVVVAVESIADELTAKIKEKMAAIRTGDGTRDNDMGPLITGQHRDKVVGYIQTAADDGADARHLDAGHDAHAGGAPRVRAVGVRPRRAVRTGRIPRVVLGPRLGACRGCSSAMTSAR